MNKFLKYWLPPIVWMCVIFYMSSQQHVSVSTESTYNFMVLKTGHMIGYAILYLLFFRAVYSQKKKQKLDEVLLRAIFYTLLYAAFDEIHQLFVPTRTGHLRDVAIDSIGVFIVYTFIKYNFKHIKHFIT